MSLLRSVLDWTAEISEWQADLFRRALAHGDIISSPTWDEAKAMVRKSIGVPIDGAAVVAPMRPKASDFSGADTSGKKLTLKSMTCLANVNAIPDGSTLPFGNEGLTVVYGENGSGKSSYARVLKKACKARAPEEIKPNIAKPKDLRLAQAQFKVLHGSEEESTIPWDTTGDSELLSRVTVFDEKCGRLIREQPTELQYAPYGSDSFSHVAKAQDKIKEELEHEKPKPVKPVIPFKDSKSKAALYYESVKPETVIANLTSRIIWSKENGERLDALREIDRQARDANLAGKVSETKAVTTTLENTFSHLRDLTTHFSSDLSAVYNKSLQELKDARAEQQLHASMSLGKEPLPNAGSVIWKSLYAAARSFNSEAYPEKPFPNTEGDALCLWCMQPLQDEAKSRLKRFDQFMDDSLEKKVQDKNTAFQAAKQEVLDMAPWPRQHFESSSRPLEQQSAAIHSAIATTYTYLSTHHQKVKEACEGAKPITAFIPVPLPESEILIWKENRERETKKLQDSLDPELLLKSQSELQELENESILHSHLGLIKKYLEECATLKKYDGAVSKLNTLAISRKGSDLIKETMSPQLKANFTSELEILGAQHLAVSFVPTTGAKGKSRHHMQLASDATHGHFDVSSILSEGEQKVIAIAGFFAELGMEEGKNPIVLDDPVTSLDHKFREKIAARLALESRKRQIIVFTHDIAFLMELEKHLGMSAGGYFAPICVSRISDAPGFCHGDRPWHSMKVKGRVGILKQEVAKINSLHASNRSQYSEKAATIYSLMRETWEALIEEDLFNEVVKRQAFGIQVLRLEGVSLEDPEFHLFDKHYDKCCTWMRGHDKSKAQDQERPAPGEILADCEAIVAFQKELSRQREAVKIRRKTTPLTPQIG